uniref:Uncharacterized protein n=1 Tax=Hyaloperonospora arabidopsidis (strain Emoy2) TaxID=559515 RepID=M4BV64_HYAAE
MTYRALVENTLTTGTCHYVRVSIHPNLQMHTGTTQTHSSRYPFNRFANQFVRCRSHVSSANDSTFDSSVSRAQSVYYLEGFRPAWILVSESSTPFHYLVRFCLNRDTEEEEQQQQPQQ